MEEARETQDRDLTLSGFAYSNTLRITRHLDDGSLPRLGYNKPPMGEAIPQGWGR